MHYQLFGITSFELKSRSIDCYSPIIEQFKVKILLFFYASIEVIVENHKILCSHSSFILFKGFDKLNWMLCLLINLIYYFLFQMIHFDAFKEKHLSINWLCTIYCKQYQWKLFWEFLYKCPFSIHFILIISILIQFSRVALKTRSFQMNDFCNEKWIKFSWKTT